MKNDYLPRVDEVEYLENYKIKITFDNGETRVFDMADRLNGEVFEPLKDPEYFKRVFADGWSISWPNGADVAPETLYHEGRS